MKRYAVCLVMLVAVVAVNVFAAAIQEVSGTLQRDKTWSGTIRVTGDVYIPPGRTLTILPGTVVRFAVRSDSVNHLRGENNCPAPKAELIVEGTLNAQGTEGKPILFTSDSATPSPGDWGGIILRGRATPVTLSYLVIEYADVNLMTFPSDIVIENCIIRNAYGGLDDCPTANHYDVRTGIFLHGERSIVRNCEIANCTWGFHINQGDRTESAIRIENCNIHDNNVTSPEFDVPNGIHVYKSNVHIEGNTIENNEWGIEIGISNVVIIDNAFISNDFGVVIYSPDGPSEGYVYDNDVTDNGMDYVRMTPAGPEPMPEDWFQDPYDTSGDSPNDANGDIAFTRVVIDGRANDWSDYPILRVDGQGDTHEGGFDLKSVQAFTNDQCLYLMVEAYGNIDEYVQIDLDIDVDDDGNKDYTATFRPRTGRRDFGNFTSGERVWGPMQGGSAAEGEVVEIKMPLALIGGRESFSLRRIRVMNGICCGEEWYVVDVMRFVPVTKVDEIEPPTPDLADFFLPSGYIAQRIFKPPLQAPNHIAISPSDVIAVTDWGASDRVIQIHKDGTLSTYVAPSPSGAHFGIVFDSASNLYVGDGPGDLWKVTPDEVVTEFASGVWGYQMDIAPSGDIFAIGGDSTFVQRITPDGRVSVYATGLTRVCDLAVSPVTGDVYVYDINAGAIYKANPDGTVRLLTAGLLHEWTYIAFSPDGKLYCMSIGTSLSIISTVDGARTELTWAKEGSANLHASDIAFDSLGRLVAVDITYNHVVRFDLGAKTMEMLWQGMGNNDALAVAPGGEGVYMGFSHPCSDGQGGVVKIEADGSTTPFVDGLPPEVCGLAFDGTGMGYVIATGPVGGDWKSTIYSITPAGIKTVLATFPSYGSSLEVDPITGYIWGLSYGELWYLDDADIRHTISTASVGEMVESLTFTPDGTLYVTINTANFLTTSVERGIYRVDPIGPAFTLIADLSTINTCCPMGRIGAGKDGNIYWVGLGDRHTPNNEPDMHMLRITPAGEVTLFGRKLAMDPCAITGDPNSTDLYFCGGNGVYRVYKP